MSSESDSSKSAHEESGETSLGRKPPDTFKTIIGAGVDSEQGDLNKWSEKRHFQGAQAESEEMSPDYSHKMQGKGDESSQDTSESPTGAGVDSEQGDLNKRSERRHFAGKFSSSIFSAEEPNEIPAGNVKEPLDFKKRKNLWY